MTPETNAAVEAALSNTVRDTAGRAQLLLLRETLETLETMEALLAETRWANAPPEMVPMGDTVALEPLAVKPRRRKGG